MAWFRSKTEPMPTESSSVNSGNRPVDGGSNRPVDEDRSFAILETDEGKKGVDDDEWYLTLKRRLHQQVVGEIDIDQMRSFSDTELREELFRKASEICNRDPNLRALPEQRRLIEQVMNEAF